jgi:hypothetical protein
MEIIQQYENNTNQIIDIHKLRIFYCEIAPDDDAFIKIKILIKIQIN